MPQANQPAYPAELSELQSCLLGIQSSLLVDEEPQLVSELGAYDAVVYRLVNCWHNQDLGDDGVLLMLMLLDREVVIR